MHQYICIVHFIFYKVRKSLRDLLVYGEKAVCHPIHLIDAGQLVIIPDVAGIMHLCFSAIFYGMFLVTGHGKQSAELIFHGIVGFNFLAFQKIFYRIAIISKDLLFDGL